MMLPENLHEFADSDRLTAALTQRIHQWLMAGIQKSGQASLVVSGGKTPLKLFQKLAQIDLPWDRVMVTLADERWVAPTHPESNELLVQTYLLQHRAAKAQFIGLKTPAESARDAEADCGRRIAQIPAPLDVVILGMGDDGHTASLFPGAAGLAAALDPASDRLCMAITPPAAHHERMTLTFPALLNARNIVLHIQGESKRKTLAQALTETGSVQAMPIRAFLFQQKAPMTVWWSP